MTRNQKIALGCGGAGCLGLIVVTVAGVLIYYFAYRTSYDRYANHNSNYNRNINLNSNENANENSNDDSTNSSSSSSSADDMSEDDKHKLFHAASVTGDLELQRRVWTKIGILEDDFTPGAKYEEFATSHGAWIIRNYQWVASISSPEKGRDYVNEHLN